MSLTLAVLYQRVVERKAQQATVERLELGQGFTIEAVHNAVLILTHESEPDTEAIVGWIEVGTGEWVLYRAWHEELIATFGSLPERVTVEAEVA